MEDTLRYEIVSDNEYLKWITEHKTYTIVLLILVIIGLGRIVRFLKK